jgi:hypothetical protein
MKSEQRFQVNRPTAGLLAHTDIAVTLRLSMACTYFPNFCFFDIDVNLLHISAQMQVNRQITGLSMSGLVTELLHFSLHMGLMIRRTHHAGITTTHTPLCRRTNETTRSEK